MDSQSRFTADFDSHCGSTCDRREDGPTAWPRALAVRRCRSADERTLAYFQQNETDDAVVSGRVYRRYRLEKVALLVDDADYLAPVLAEDGYRFQILARGNRNATERVF